jgi:hypothetical protein
VQLRTERASFDQYQSVDTLIPSVDVSTKLETVVQQLFHHHPMLNGRRPRRGFRDDVERVLSRPRWQANHLIPIDTVCHGDQLLRRDRCADNTATGLQPETDATNEVGIVRRLY